LLLYEADYGVIYLTLCIKEQGSHWDKEIHQHLYPSPPIYKKKLINLMVEIFLFFEYETLDCSRAIIGLGN